MDTSHQQPATPQADPAGPGRSSSVAVETGLTIAQFQGLIRERYEKADRARGTAATWLWFSEEIGELARALARNDNRANLEEEFADVVAWLCTLANINDVDLESAIRAKYLGADAPTGTK